MTKNLTKRKARNLQLKGTRHLPDPDVVARCYACGGPIFNESRDDVGPTTARHVVCPRGAA